MAEFHEPPKGLPRVPEPNLSPNIREFLKRNQTAIDEDAELRNKHITTTIGSSGSPKDIEKAEELFEQSQISDTQIWREKREKGLIILVPPLDDKHTMVALETADPEIFDLFNRAASLSTKEYGGFHQVGAEREEGYTAWELWNQGNARSYQIIEGVFKQMQNLAGK